MAENDAVALYRAGEKKLGTDEKIFVQIFSGHSAAQLAAINQCYNTKYGHSLKKVFYSTPFFIFPYLAIFLALIQPQFIYTRQ